MTEFQQELMHRAVVALESIAENARMIANPTDEELRDRIQRSMSTAVFLDAERSEGEPLN